VRFSSEVAANVKSLKKCILGKMFNPKKERKKRKEILFDPKKARKGRESS